MRLIALMAVASALFAQGTPPLSNAHLESRAFRSDLNSELRSEAAAWFGYRIKSVHTDDGSCCWSDSNRGCWLETDAGPRSSAFQSNGPVHLEDTNSAAVLFRVEHNQIQKIHLFSMSCPLDAGGLSFVWLNGVPAQESIRVLRHTAVTETSDHLRDAAIFAIAQHDDPQADTTLDQLAGVDQPEKIREKVAFWLGAARGESGVKGLQQMLNNDRSEQVRDKAVFALSISKQPDALNTLIQSAKTDSSAHVRSQAIFWLAQKAGKQAVETITGAIQNDPDTGVKKKAVFALSQLPKDEGVPKLIEVARTQRNAEVRKQAFFWLGQSGDPRALAYIEQVLTR